jgi:hypothetical protein
MNSGNSYILTYSNIWLCHCIVWKSVMSLCSLLVVKSLSSQIFNYVAV